MDDTKTPNLSDLVEAYIDAGGSLRGLAKELAKTSDDATLIERWRRRLYEWKRGVRPDDEADRLRLAEFFGVAEPDLFPPAKKPAGAYVRRADHDRLAAELTELRGRVTVLESGGQDELPTL